jgi:hypothetical protein
MFNFFKNTDDTLKFYMKSGNSFVIDKVTDWNLQTGVTVDAIVSLSITQSPSAKNKLLVKSISLAQIEAIVRVEA